MIRPDYCTNAVVARDPALVAPFYNQHALRYVMCAKCGGNIGLFERGYYYLFNVAEVTGVFVFEADASGDEEDESDFTDSDDGFVSGGADSGGE